MSHLRPALLLLAAACAVSCRPEPIVVSPIPDAPPAPPPPELSAAPSQTSRVNQVAGDAPPPKPVAAVSTCSLDARVASMGTRCERLRAVAAQGTGPWRSAAPFGPPAAAFDGDSCTIWNAGAPPPQSATVDLGSAMAISALLLVPEMTPANAAVVHAIEVSDDGKVFRRVGEVRAPMRSGDAVELPIPGGVVARFVRVSTLSSPSWVAWRDIVPVRCAR